MTSPSTKKPCSKCEKGAGVTTCDGCEQSFCIKHIVEHRQELAVQMDDIGQEHDSLRRDFIQENWIHPLSLRIDQWEQESITKVQVTAERARADLHELVEQMTNNVKTSVDKLATELQTHRELDDYTENDLRKWSVKLKELRKLFETPSNIQIIEGENTSGVIHLIQVAKLKPVHSSSRAIQITQKSLQSSSKSFPERFDKKMDSIYLLEDCSAAAYSGALYSGYQTIFGKNLYRSGIHRVQFHIENKSKDNFFFGIVTSLQTIESHIFDTSSANGWWGFDFPVVNGQREGKCGDKVLQTGDTATLTLDCDSRRIQFEHHRTGTIVHSSINTMKCPFPWKVVVSLSKPDDILRILS